MRKFSRRFFALLHRRSLKWQFDDDMAADAVRRLSRWPLPSPPVHRALRIHPASALRYE